jgi:hypothetical protein
MTTSPAPCDVGAAYAHYSALWFSTTEPQVYAEMAAIEEWAKTAEADNRREHEMLAAILYAGTTGALAAGDLLAQPTGLSLH